MKKILTHIILLAIVFICNVSCEKSDIPYYNSEHDAVRFSNDSKLGYSSQDSCLYNSYSFISDPFAEYTIFEVPLTLIGNPANANREVNYTIEEKSTAPAASYEILESLIPANKNSGYIRIKLYNSEELANSTYELYFTLKNSKSLPIGPSPYLRARLSWNSAIEEPTVVRHIQTYNMLIASKKSYIDRTKACYSSNALKTIVDALGWDDWDDPNVHGKYYNPPGTYKSYKYLPRYDFIFSDLSYKGYAAKLRDYIKAYNIAHPDSPLTHDGGDLKGQPIEARSY